MQKRICHLSFVISTIVFSGVRKSIAPAFGEEVGHSKHGTELTYSLLVINKEADFQDYLDNKAADVHYKE